MSTRSMKPRRRVASWGIASLAAGALLVAGLPSMASADTADAAGRDWSFNPVTALTAATFASPASNDKPWVRWNVPVTAVNATLESQLQDMHDKGIGGVELGQGGFPSNDQLTAIYSKANALGIKVSLSHGPTQNPTGYTFNNDNARKSLFVGRSIVGAGAAFSGAVPRPAPVAGRADTLVAVLAYRCTDAACGPIGLVDLDRSSVIDLTSTVTGTNTDGFADGSTAGSVSWTAPAAPAGARWQLIGFWARGVFAQPDPFSSEGHDEIVASMQGYLSPQVVGLMRANGGDIFYDSHSSDRGSPDELWSNDMAAEFEDRAGYDLTPDLAAIIDNAFTFSDGSDDRILADLIETRTDMWLDNHILPMQDFVRDEYNAVLRVQPEGERTITIPIYDQARVAAVLDRPEHESLFVGDEVDNYLPIASANHMTGNPWYSTECCAVRSGAHTQTFEDMRVRMAKSYAGGITKLVYHTYAYADSPTHRWPGYANFGNTSFSSAWGPRTPIWTDALEYNEYFARNEQVLTQGDAKVDVAVFYQNYLYPEPWSNPGGFRIWRDLGLQNAGYTRDYLSPELMKQPNAVVSDGRLAEEGPAYKALIIDSTLEPAVDPVKTSMPLDAASRILGYARAGLPVVLVGALPDRTTGNTPEDDAALKAVIAQLVATPGVHRVANQAAVPGKLKELGIRPAAEPAESTTLLSQRRVDAATDTSYHYLYNEGIVTAPGQPQNIFEPVEICETIGVVVCSGTGEPVSTVVALEGEGYPFLLDAMTGEISAIAEYSVEDGRVLIPLDFKRDESKIIALSTRADRFGVAPAAGHAVETDADAGVVYDGDRLVARSTQAGEFSTKLDNQTTYTSAFTDVPAPVDLTGATWSLVAEDWKPTNDWATTFGPAATQTTKDKISVTLNGLKSWRQIPELQNSSGLGVYTTTFTLPQTWSADNGAIVDLGTVMDSFTLTVNGEAVPINQGTSLVDLRDQLRAGENTISVRVATTLVNRLATLDPTVNTRGIFQNYGLLGPVLVTPYTSVAVPTEVEVSASTTSVAWKAYVTVTVVNHDTVPVAIEVTTPYGGKSFANVKPGREVTVSINSKQASIPAGTATVKVTKTVDGERVVSTQSVDYPAHG